MSLSDKVFRKMSNPLVLSAYKEPILVERSKYGVWATKHNDNRVERHENATKALEQRSASMLAAGIALSNNTQNSGPAYKPSFAELDKLPKWTPARWTNGHWTAPSMPATELPVTERYKRSATSWGIGSLMEAGRRAAKQRVASRIITDPYQ